jgi:hypothetical protein
MPCVTICVMFSYTEMMGCCKQCSDVGWLDSLTHIQMFRWVNCVIVITTRFVCLQPKAHRLYQRIICRSYGQQLLTVNSNACGTEVRKKYRHFMQLGGGIYTSSLWATIRSSALQLSVGVWGRKVISLHFHCKWVRDLYKNVELWYQINTTTFFKKITITLLRGGRTATILMDCAYPSEF